MMDPSNYDGISPGPWTLGSSKTFIVSGQEFMTGMGAVRSVVADCESNLIPKKEAEANARLIVDAPLILAEYEELKDKNRRLINIETNNALALSEQAEIISLLKKEIEGFSKIIDLIETVDRCETWDGGSPEMGTIHCFGKIVSICKKALSSRLVNND